MIDATGIELIFNPGDINEKHVLRGVDLQVAEGELVTLIGSNGAGKSTLLRVLSGEVAPTAGRIVMDGVDVTRLAHHQRATHLAQVFQDPLAGTCAALTIAENLSLASMRGRQRGLAMAISATRRADFRQRLEILGLGLENRIDDSVGLLSGGQRQALSLIMTTLAPSRVLLLDEHTAALDPRMSAFVLELTVKLYERFKLTTVMVTHSMRDALAVGSRTVLMHQGRVENDLTGEARAQATPESLFAEFNRLHDRQMRAEARPD